jgi:hypothetical protein
MNLKIEFANLVLNRFVWPILLEIQFVVRPITREIYHSLEGNDKFTDIVKISIIRLTWRWAY